MFYDSAQMIYNWFPIFSKTVRIDEITNIQLFLKPYEILTFS